MPSFLPCIPPHPSRLHLQVLDGALGCAQGALRGMGRQNLLFMYNVGGFWGCGVLIGYLLAYHVGWGLRGLWVGICIGDTVASLLCVGTVLLGVDWQEEVGLAAKRLEESRRADAAAAASCWGEEAGGTDPGGVL